MRAWKYRERLICIKWSMNKKNVRISGKSYQCHMLTKTLSQRFWFTGNIPPKLAILMWNLITSRTWKINVVFKALLLFNAHHGLFVHVWCLSSRCYKSILDNTKTYVHKYTKERNLSNTCSGPKYEQRLHRLQMTIKGFYQWMSVD